MGRIALIMKRLLCAHTWELASRRNWIYTYRCPRCTKTKVRRDY